MNRCVRREATFLDDEVCSVFIAALEEVPVRFGARIQGVALMPSHYHLMLEVPLGNVSDGMQPVGGVFTQDFNRLRGHDGPVVGASETRWSRRTSTGHTFSRT